MASKQRSSDDCLVRFEPDGISIRVPRGTSILDAALSCGVSLDSVCGGEGRCGRCKVRARGAIGSIYGSEKAMLSPGTERTVLACMSTVEGDLDVLVPEFSRIGVHQILESSEHVSLKGLSPLVRKESLNLYQPTVKDNLSDLERIRRGFLDTMDRRASVSLAVLRTIPKAVREKDWEVTVSLAEAVYGQAMVAIEPGDTCKDTYGICIDIGTTTVVLSLVDLITGVTLSTESNYNKQIMCGEDVLSRISYAEEHGTKNLTKLITETINYLISQACESASNSTGRNITPRIIVTASVAGNPAMIHFFLGLDTHNMRLEPYVPVANIPQCPRASEIGLKINPTSLVYICPGRAGYVGGDVLADVLASGMHLKKKLSLLIDVGTNGEVVLGSKDWMVCCSCSAGPAFEGGEVSSGMRAMRGAIDRLRLTKSGDVRYHTIGDTDPLGICGSGLVDLISELFVHDLIDRSGNFHKEMSNRVREGEDGELEFFIAKRGMGELARGWVDEAPRDIAIKESDIRNILRTKAAIYSSCSVLLKSMDKDIGDIHQIVIAGGFGQYLDIRKAIMIGLFPDVDLKKYRFIGNGSLEGARLVLLSRQKRKEIFGIHKSMTYFELSVSGMFFDEFTSALFLPHTDLDRFPSDKALLALEKSNTK